MQGEKQMWLFMVLTKKKLLTLMNYFLLLFVISLLKCFLCYLFDLELEQLDVETFVLHDKLEQEIYMKQPEVFVLPRKQNFVCYLRRSLHGLNMHHGNAIKGLMLL